MKEEYLVSYNLIMKNGSSAISRSFVEGPRIGSGELITRQWIMRWEQRIILEWRDSGEEIGTVRITNFQRINC